MLVKHSPKPPCGFLPMVDLGLKPLLAGPELNLHRQRQPFQLAVRAGAELAVHLEKSGGKKRISMVISHLIILARGPKKCGGTKGYCTRSVMIMVRFMRMMRLMRMMMIIMMTMMMKMMRIMMMLLMILMMMMMMMMMMMRGR